jgi:hypothetical protein
MKKLLFVAIAFMALFSSCKKKDVEKTTAEKIAGKWILVTEVYNDYYNNAPHVTTSAGTAADNIDFRSDGKVYDNSGNFSVPYSVIGDNKVSFGGSTYDIKALDDAQLILYEKVPGVGTEYEETTNTFKR